MSKQCRMCSRTRPTESARAYTRQWKAANLDRYPHYRRRAKYGLEPEDYAAMLREQDGRCRICAAEMPLKPYCKDCQRVRRKAIYWRDPVDHCHDTGVVRGLLCDRCNRGLGFFDHDPDRFLAAAAYLIAAGEREAVDA